MPEEIMRRDLEQHIGKGVQLFRVRFAERHFEELADLGPLNERMIAGRRVWRLKGTGTIYALLTIPYKDEEKILVKVDNPEWTEWNWGQLAEIAEECRWSGPDLDKRWID
jgi:hypothetical protein